MEARRLDIQYMKYLVMMTRTGTRIPHEHEAKLDVATYGSLQGLDMLDCIRGRMRR